MILSQIILTNPNLRSIGTQCPDSHIEKATTDKEDAIGEFFEATRKKNVTQPSSYQHQEYDKKKLECDTQLEKMDQLQRAGSTAKSPCVVEGNITGAQPTRVGNRLMHNDKGFWQIEKKKMKFKKEERRMSCERSRASQQEKEEKRWSKTVKVGEEVSWKDEQSLIVSHLPLEMIHEITKHLSFKDQKNLMRTSTRMLDLYEKYRSWFDGAKLGTITLFERQNKLYLKYKNNVNIFDEQNWTMTMWNGEIERLIIDGSNVAEIFRTFRNCQFEIKSIVLERQLTIQQASTFCLLYASLMKKQPAIESIRIRLFGTAETRETKIFQVMHMIDNLTTNRLNMKVNRYADFYLLEFRK